ncbi:hypothetical protein ACJMK2_005976 [Sinanodonta woodiana]|uniref:Ferric-chelate reductase 1 n=1 Tax=Sinanodonta woodiana TaxID=1069815 RepID=A0ABD3VV88_SINWO
MFPKHKSEKQTSESPFLVKLSPQTYIPGSYITVSVYSNDRRNYRGIQLRAFRQDGEPERSLGSFVQFPENKTKVYDCWTDAKSIVTHRNNDEVQMLEFTWKAPDQNVGNIIFVATVVEKYNLFWFNITTELRSGQPTPPRPMIEQITPEVKTIAWDQCGKTKGCFLYPRMCQGSDCYAAVSFRKNDDTIEFELLAEAEGYVSVGFSADTKMGEDETISCTAAGDRLTVQHGFNPLYYNALQYRTNLTDMEVQHRDGRIYCRFTRPMVSQTYGVGSGMYTFDLNNKYYIFLAWGRLYKGTDVMEKHVELPAVSDNVADFLSTVIMRGSSLPEKTRVHGSLMIVAWMLLVGIATVIARHFKSMFKSKKLLGTKIWFQIHRAAAVLAWTLTAISFIIIFVHVGGLTKLSATHGYVGIAVMAASSVQVLAGMLRPGLDSSIRPVFNWGHWFLGKSSHILSAVSLFLAFNSVIIPGTQKIFGTIVIAVWTGVQIAWEFLYEIKKCRNSGPFYEPQNPANFEIEKKNGTSGKTKCDMVLLGAYLFTLTVLVVVGLLSVLLF